MSVELVVESVVISIVRTLRGVGALDSSEPQPTSAANDRKAKVAVMRRIQKADAIRRPPITAQKRL